MSARGAQLDKPRGASRRFWFRLSQGERFVFEQAARADGVTLSAWIRALGRAEVARRRQAALALDALVLDARAHATRR